MQMGQALLPVLLLVLLAIWCQAERPEYCNEFADPGRKCSRSRIRSGPRYFYDQRTNRCMQFYYYGCYGNQNNFDSPSTCESECGLTQAEKCRLPLDTGRGFCPDSVRASRRFYFNEETGSCEEFDFTCSGNDNNFETQVECVQLCTPATFYGIPEDSPCLTPSIQAVCERNRRDEFTFDPTSGACVVLSPYKCVVSGNVFEDFAVCLSTCNPKRKTLRRELGKRFDPSERSWDEPEREYAPGDYTGRQRSWDEPEREYAPGDYTGRQRSREEPERGYPYDYSGRDTFGFD